MLLKKKIKVCGMTSVEQIAALTEMPVEYAGLIFEKSSPRYVRNKIKGSELAEVEKRIKLVGVFVNEDLQVILQTIREYNLDAVQLCGEESPDDCDGLRNLVEVFKVLPVKDKSSATQWINRYRGHCDFFLFDTHDSKPDGTGEKFDWTILRKMAIRHFFFLGGGIGPAEVSAVKAFKEPHHYGIDLNSNFELSPGIKDLEQIKAFIEGIEEK